MFGLFKKKDPADKLRGQYKKLLNEAFELSKTDRKASDEKHAEADRIMKEIEALQANN